MSRFSASQNVEIHGDLYSATGNIFGHIIARKADDPSNTVVELHLDGKIHRIHEDLLTLLAQAFGGKP